MSLAESNLVAEEVKSGETYRAVMILRRLGCKVQKINRHWHLVDYERVPTSTLWKMAQVARRAGAE